MFDRVLHTPLPLDSYFNNNYESQQSLSTYCCSRMFEICSFKIAMQLKIVVLTLLHDGGPYHVESSSLVCSVNMERVKEFLSLICYIIVSRSYNNTVFYKINTCIKKQCLIVQLEINWRRKLKPLTDPVFHMFFTKHHS